MDEKYKKIGVLIPSFLYIIVHVFYWNFIFYNLQKTTNFCKSKLVKSSYGLYVKNKLPLIFLNPNN